MGRSQTKIYILLAGILTALNHAVYIKYVVNREDYHSIITITHYHPIITIQSLSSHCYYSFITIHHYNPTITMHQCHPIITIPSLPCISTIPSLPSHHYHPIITIPSLPSPIITIPSLPSHHVFQVSNLCIWYINNFNTIGIFMHLINICHFFAIIILWSLCKTSECLEYFPAVCEGSIELCMSIVIKKTLIIKTFVIELDIYTN